ncbi:metal-dependent transcriptional regulator [Gleimia sp. 6138-11-ORH1]|uniref:metal-dependent transcriptional regulator n=1 Tax=Gleimia sp. 6138-11-ORH1 TaxID=2973937 RepID=UPI002169BA05|nr:metal-dependent transcriptional regulator [Gleimia sp. 6138-11-ORH1]MCS4484904.1 metal-dependent transcriptional regulator [Gleimia sp. 6138-11-ORH1]
MKPRISTMSEDYVRAIYSAEEWDEKGVGVSDLANLMGVVPSTASENVRRLKEAGLVDHKPYQQVRLTPAGREQAMKMVRRHRILETFLHQVLEFSWDEVHEEAEQLEHAVSERFIDQIDKVLDYPATDPHGDPIPRKDGSVASSSPLSVLTAPTEVPLEIVRIRDAEPEVLRHFESRGITPGKQVLVLEKSDVTALVGLEVAGQRVDLPYTLGAFIRVLPL